VTVSFRAKNASRGDRTVCGCTVQAAAAAGRRGAARRRSIEAIRVSMNITSRSSSSAIDGMGTRVSRSPNSTGMPAAIRSASTRLPFAPVPASSTTSLAGSTPGPSSTSTPGTSRSRRRAAATPRSSRAHSRYPSRASRARVASMLATIEPAGLVVWVASNARFSLATSRRSVRASINAPWV